MGFSRLERIQRSFSGCLATGFALSMSDSDACLLSSVKKAHPSIGGFAAIFNHFGLSGVGKNCFRNDSVFGANYHPSPNRKRSQLNNIRHVTEFDGRGRKGMSLEVKLKFSAEGRHVF